MKIKNDEIITKLAELTEGIAKINERIDAITAPPVVSHTSPSIAVTTSTPAGTEVAGHPIPLEYQELVNTLLNKKFKVHIDYKPDQVAFEFAILVPKEYSNAGENHWGTYGEDRRSKVIQNAYGANGVREWVLQVYDNLTPEVRSAITYDRAQL